MRVRPTLAIGLGIFVVYLVIVTIVWAVTDIDYDTVTSTIADMRKGIILAVGLGGVFLAVAATYLGWWRPALFEPRRFGSTWMVVVVAAALVVGAVINLAQTDWDASVIWWKWLAYAAVATALVGFSEEMLCRGLLIVGARGSLPEVWVWFTSAAAFALLHVTNAFFGQGLGATAGQVVFAFLVGTAYYVLRLTSGTLIVTMVLHAMWDFSTFTFNESTEDVTNVAAFAMYIAVIAAVVALPTVIRERTAEADQAPAAA